MPPSGRGPDGLRPFFCPYDRSSHVFFLQIQSLAAAGLSCGGAAAMPDPQGYAASFRADGARDGMPCWLCLAAGLVDDGGAALAGDLAHGSPHFRLFGRHGARQGLFLHRPPGHDAYFWRYHHRRRLEREQPDRAVRLLVFQSPVHTFQSGAHDPCVHTGGRAHVRHRAQYPARHPVHLHFGGGGAILRTEPGKQSDALFMYAFRYSAYAGRHGDTAGGRPQHHRHRHRLHDAGAGRAWACPCASSSCCAVF